MTVNTVPEEPSKPSGAPTWMVTFADMMSLLMCLFVLMLSFAEMDAQRYRMMAGSMKDAFGTHRETRLMGLIELKGIKTTREKADSILKSEPKEKQEPVTSITVDLEKVISKHKTENQADVTKTLKSALTKELESNTVSLHQEGEKIIVRFPGKLAFPIGEVELSEQFKQSLNKVAQNLPQSTGDITVFGHTDNRPISTFKYRSNWELSSARAASVVHYLIEHMKIDASRMTATGYADSRPLAPNDTPKMWRKSSTPK